MHTFGETTFVNRHLAQRSDIAAAKQINRSRDEHQPIASNLSPRKKDSQNADRCSTLY